MPGSMRQDRAIRPPGGFQLRHARLGIFQGTALQMACWHPSSSMPEYGLCRFHTEADAQRYIDFLSSPQCPEPLAREDFAIEPFDHAQHEALIYEHPLESEWESGR